MAGSVSVRLTGNFLGNLDAIEQFLQEAEAPAAFDGLLADLSDTVIPNLERFPDMGRLFADRPIATIEASVAATALQKKVQAVLGSGEIREYVLPDYLILYVRKDTTVFLLAIRHHQRVFNLHALNHQADTQVS